MGTWLKHDVITVVNAPLENVWNTWSDLASMSLWMSWIESVKTVDEETNTLPDLTEWTLAANGFRFKWKAQITERVEKSKLKWKSIGGLPTEGSVFFESKSDQITSISNFFMAGSYTKQDYIDSMEGATMSGHLAAAAILEKKAELAKNLAVS